MANRSSPLPPLFYPRFILAFAKARHLRHRLAASRREKFAALTLIGFATASVVFAAQRIFGAS